MHLVPLTVVAVICIILLPLLAFQLLFWCRCKRTRDAGEGGGGSSCIGDGNKAETPTTATTFSIMSRVRDKSLVSLTQSTPSPRHSSDSRDSRFYVRTDMWQS